ncbi:hypothetical protein SAMN05216387_11920 [Nitrosovibrio tenuis]|uniref:Uncharacterized protein n=1 Tax=Nitrosovibrio tenuis TaxID=1233 RepID=A0A1H7RRV4_9PROT|nr:hypothetical protein SAMN05216387_11920 [Nitrosovibrio tenuis]
MQGLVNNKNVRENELKQFRKIETYSRAGVRMGIDWRALNRSCQSTVEPGCSWLLMVHQLIGDTPHTRGCIGG